MAFNAISTFVNYREEMMYYLDPIETARFCIEKLSRRVTLAHHNLPYNYTVFVFRSESWISVSK
jgi:hypothetical protein